ncbi:hypothetical protein B7494_g4394 [Chlorociboria aeruginascens]|nr:hypothetical protein B7494_g4394 [Chlorociboria aeruginascens]
MQPTLLTPATYHTTAPNSLRTPDTCNSTSPAQKRRVSLAKHNVLFKHTPSTRSSSSISSTASPSSSTPTTASSNPALPTEHLDWNTFFKLRKTRRLYQLGSSITTGIGGVMIGAQVISNTDMESIIGQLPLEPFVALGLMTAACGGVGWLTGPILGTSVFNWRNRRFKSQMDAKEKEFYGRVKKYRVDPSASSMANPVPDYYGEKIASVAGYRSWLKDQRAFNKKRKIYV